MALTQHKLTALFNDNEITIPYYELDGDRDGYQLTILAGQHGNEINGIMVGQRFLQWLEVEIDATALTGNVCVVPVANPSGFLNSQREVAEDGKDLNRCYGVEKASTLAEAMALELYEAVIKKADVVVDLHSGGGWVLMNHVRIHKNPGDACSRELAQSFGSKLLVERNGEKGMLAVELNRLSSKPVLTIEVGGPDRVYPEMIEGGVQGLLNVMRYLNLLDGEPVLPKEQFVLKNRYGAKAQTAGIVQWQVSLGERVHAGDVLGEFIDPLKRIRSSVVAERCGLVFSLRMRAQVQEEDFIYSILEDHECHVERETLDVFTQLAPLEKTRIDM